MSFALLFAVLMLAWLFFGLFGSWPGAAPNPHRPFYGNGVLFVLLLLLGWKVFGPLLFP
jgi:hypothetical protein